MNNSRLLKVMLSVAVVLGGAGFIVYSSLGHAEYYKMVDEVMVEPTEWVDKSMRIHGFVEAGSIDEQIVDQKMKRTFVLENKGQSILVHHTGPVPDTFKDLSEVVAKGKLVQADGVYVLEATELSAKCPSKYEGAPRNKDLGSGQTAEKPVF